MWGGKGKLSDPALRAISGAKAEELGALIVDPSQTAFTQGEALRPNITFKTTSSAIPLDTHDGAATT